MKRKKLILLAGLLTWLLASFSLAQALSTVTVTGTFTAYGTVDTTHSAATGATVQYRSDGGAWTTYCAMIFPTVVCTGAAVPIGHSYDFQILATNGFGSSPPTTPWTLGAYPPSGVGGPVFTYSVQ